MIQYALAGLLQILLLMLKKSKITGGIIQLMSGSLIAQLITLIVSPVLTRIYSPEQFGEYSFFASIVAVVAVGATGRYEVAILLQNDEKNVRIIKNLTIVLLILYSLIALIIIGFLSLFQNFDHLIFFIPLVVAFISVNSIYDKIFNRKKNYHFMALQKILSAATTAIASLFVAWKFEGINGLILGAIAGPLVSAWFVMNSSKYSMEKSNTRLNLTELSTIAKSYLNLPKYNLPHAVLNTFSESIPIFLIQFFFGNEILGIYALGVRMVLSPINIVSAAAYNVISQNFAEENCNGKSLHTSFASALKKLILVLLAALPLFLFSPNIFAYIFGEKWRIAGNYAQILAPYFALILLAAPFAYLPIIFNRQKKALAIEMVSTLAKVASLIIGGLADSIYVSLMFFSLSGTCIALFTLSWYYKMVNEIRLTKTIQ